MRRPHTWLKLLIRPLDWRFGAKWYRRAQSAFLFVGPIELAVGWDLALDEPTHCCSKPEPDNA